MKVPKAYAMIMALLQTIVLEEIYPLETHVKYKCFMKDLQLNISQVAEHEDEEERWT